MSRKRDTNWSRDEITVLLDSIMEFFRIHSEEGKKTNSREVFEYAAKKLGEKGHSARAEREKCRTKWKKMKEEFTHAKRAREGDTRYKEAPGIQPFYDRMDDFIKRSFDNISPHSTIVRRASSVSSSNSSRPSPTGMRISTRLAMASTNGTSTSSSHDNNDTSNSTIATRTNTSTDYPTNMHGTPASNQASPSPRQNSRSSSGSGNSNTNNSNNTNNNVGNTGNIIMSTTNNNSTNNQHNLAATPSNHHHHHHHHHQQQQQQLKSSHSASNTNALPNNSHVHQQEVSTAGLCSIYGTYNGNNGGSNNNGTSDGHHSARGTNNTNHINGNNHNVSTNSSTSLPLIGAGHDGSSNSNNNNNQTTEHADISYRVSSGCRQITIFGDHDVDIKFRGDCVTINKIDVDFSTTES